MKPILFVTGASGFVGRRVVQQLVGAGYEQVVLLARDPDRVRGAGQLPAGWSVVRGDVAAPGAWAAKLAGVDTILHLAAPTGKARRREHIDVTANGTKLLVEHARRARVARFLHVSSIAAAFTHRRYYHYADAKRDAEAHVRASGLEWLIVRPTMVLGPGSPVLEGLQKLARLPVPVVFGNALNEIQPIAVGDLAALLVAALDIRPWPPETVTAGGPDIVRLIDLMRRVRAGAGKGQARFLHLPLAPVREMLGVAEPLLFPVLPFTAGQLATFANAGRAEPNALLARLPAPRVRLDDMLRADSP